MPFIPHTEDDVRAMLGAIGVARIEDLFEEIPAALRAGPLAGLPPALNEMQVGRLMEERAARDGRALSFIGAGAYEHHIPAAVWAIVTRGEFYSAYTPYQAEASQGTLQMIYEYQTMMASLTGLAASNASLYDGASALAEAALMAVRAHRKSQSARILVPASVNPTYVQVARAIAGNQSLEFETVPYCTVGGHTEVEALRRFEGRDVTALVIQQPNFFGTLEDVDELTDWAHAHGALVIAVVNPTALAVLKPPGEWGASGADIVCGEGQPLGVPLSSGGPYFGFMTTRMEFVRQMPGRIVGRTVDLEGRTGFTLTLQAREQHIRRGKATSNICTNQGLLMMAATIYLSLIGPRGLAEVASACVARTHALVDALSSIPGVRVAFDRARFHEAVLLLDRPVGPVLEALAARGIEGGLDLAVHFPELGPALLVCATETKTQADIDAYARALADVMKTPHPSPLPLTGERDKSPHPGPLPLAWERG
jgi:glycine dehydrogenase subunit 1